LSIAIKINFVYRVAGNSKQRFGNGARRVLRHALLTPKWQT